MVTKQGKNSVIKFRMWISIKKHLILLGVDFGCHEADLCTNEYGNSNFVWYSIKILFHGKCMPITYIQVERHQKKNK